MAKRHVRPAPLKVFGSEVRRFRELAELSQAQLGDKIPISSSHIGKIERGETRCDRKLAVRMDEILDTRGSLPSLWDELVEKAVFPAWFDWPEIETEAIRLQSYECLVVYGLLQTESYAAALLEDDPQAVSARIGRQEILHRQDPPPPRLPPRAAMAVMAVASVAVTLALAPGQRPVDPPKIGRREQRGRPDPLRVALRTHWIADFFTPTPPRTGDPSLYYRTTAGDVLVAAQTVPR
jgi:transcriptional regulator with XRE-family HTH domain